MKPFLYLQILSLLFIAAKLFGAIDWSWWYVLAPLLAWPLLSFCIGLVIGIRKGYRTRRMLDQARETGRKVGRELYGKGGSKV
jgi:UPF0716 family protein affecting phage T7 exclusion